MPVISEPSRGGPNLPSYIVLGLLLVLFLTLFRARKRTLPPILPLGMPSQDQALEKDPSTLTEAAAAPARSPQEPTPRSASPEPLPMQSSQAMYDFDSFEPEMTPEMPPRRRSYTKATTSSEGVEVLVNGEIVVAEGWRRHTRVFGGGVCKACEESERKMAA
jgi:hypothetical protein